MDEPPYRLCRILTETYATAPSRGGACNRWATRTLDGRVNVLTVSVLLPKQVWRRLPTRTNRLLVEPRATSLVERPSDHCSTRVRQFTKPRHWNTICHRLDL